MEPLAAAQGYLHLPGRRAGAGSKVSLVNDSEVDAASVGFLEDLDRNRSQFEGTGGGASRGSKDGRSGEQEQRQIEGLHFD
jgi:hypothetical protein